MIDVKKLHTDLAYHGIEIALNHLELMCKLYEIKRIPPGS
jgi:hypothetical protein